LIRSRRIGNVGRASAVATAAIATARRLLVDKEHCFKIGWREHVIIGYRISLGLLKAVFASWGAG